MQVTDLDRDRGDRPALEFERVATGRRWLGQVPRARRVHGSSLALEALRVVGSARLDATRAVRGCDNDHRAITVPPTPAAGSAGRAVRNGAGNREVAVATADGSDDGRVEGTTSEPGHAGLSRRDALRRFGIAAGVAWTAPVVMSLYSPAGAQTVGSPGPSTTTSTTAPPDLECIGGTCGELPELQFCEPGLRVRRRPPTALGFCTPGSLACADLAECGPDGACPPGTTCALDTCCGTPVCIPLTAAGECPPDPTARQAAGVRVSTGPGTVGG